MCASTCMYMYAGTCAHETYACICTTHLFYKDELPSKSFTLVTGRGCQVRPRPCTDPATRFCGEHFWVLDVCCKSLGTPFLLSPSEGYPERSTVASPLSHTRHTLQGPAQDSAITPELPESGLRPLTRCRHCPSSRPRPIGWARLGDP